ncbi:acyltransferase [Sphingobacterium endophyticum]|uniref:acyltransferase n=1 Tax=Sphingobacterium endophyticum TaxID=2546448 RepID=UPI0018CFC95E|nr:acyltransferase [Sphingobacterium endophyticum]
MRGNDIFKLAKPMLRGFAFVFSLFPNFLILFLWDCISNHGGKIFIAFRYILLKAICKEVGDNVYVGKYVVIKNHKNIEIGNNVSIHDYCYLEGAGNLFIGNNVSIAHNCSILTANHTWYNSNIPIKYNPETFQPVIIKSDVWIGCGVRILAGVTINSRSIAAAGAVVNKDIETGTIVGGIPCKVLKNI